MRTTTASSSVSVTPSDRRPIALAALVLLAVAGASGALRLVLDADAPFRLPDDHPVEQATVALQAATGGDDVVLVALYGGDVLSADGVAAIEAVRAGLAASASLDGVRAVTQAPILAVRDGLLTVETPLVPTPADGARDRVLADRFAVGPLVGEDGTVALIPGWIRRQEAGPALVARATAALKDAELRATPAGAAVTKAVNDARLAVVLGNAEGPADAAVEAALRTLATEGPAVALVGQWLQAAEAAATDPEGAALADARAALAAVTLPAGLHAEVLGAPAVAAAAAEAFPQGVALLLIGLCVFAGLAAAVNPGGALAALRSVVAVSLGALAAAGGLGWLGAPLHGVTALAPIIAGAVAGLLASGGPRPVPVVAASVLPLLGLGIALSPVDGGLRAGLLAVGAGVLVGVLLWRGDDSAPLDVGTTAAPKELVSPVLQAGLVLAVGCGAALIQPAGLDPARLLDARHPVGAATAALDTAAGMGAPAQLVLTGDGERPMAAPSALAELRAAQDALEAQEGVRSTVSWADCMAAIHERVSGAAPGALPDEPALVDQYLLLFGRPDATRPLVSRDLAVGSGLVRLQPGEGARLASLARTLPGPVRLGGQAVRIATAAERTAHRAAVGLLIGLALAMALVVRSRPTPEVVVSTVAACLAAAAATSWWAGALSLEALVAAGLVFAAGQGTHARSGALFLGAALAMLSPVVPMASLGLGLAAGAAALLALRALRS